MSVDFLSKNFPPFQVHHAKKPPRFYPDGFQRNVIDFYFIFSDCRLRKALYLQFSYFIWPLVTYWHVGSFITTLGFSYVLEGIVLLLTNSQPISGLPEAFLVIGRGYLGPIPVPVIILAVTFILSAFVIKYMKFGRNVLAVGENAGAAKLCGINVAKNKIAVFAVAGLASAFGGIVLASRLSSGQPSSGGDLSLQVLAAVYVGGTSSGSMSAILAGVLILQLISNGLNLFGVSGYWQKVALGIIIVLAVALDMFRLERATNRD